MTYRLDESELSNTEQKVWNVLKGRLGRQNAITAAAIEELTGVNRFQCCKVVQTLRLSHSIPVVASKYHGNRGYFLPLLKSEVRETVDEFVRQAEIMLNVVDVLNEAPLL